MAAIVELAAQQLQLNLTPQHAEAFARYAQALADWNEKINLTAITRLEEVEVRHFLDSLTIAAALPLHAGMKVIDVGTGAGFPGIPLQIVYPDLKMTLLEATGKKIVFLDHIITLLSLPNTRTLKARAEEAGNMPPHRQAYDLALARAVARLPILLEYLLPLLKIGAICVAMKGKTAEAEAGDSTHALQVLGGRIQKIEAFQLPDVDETHHLVLIEKVAPTPAGYPRRPGLPNQNPL
jgi:16S rRNA (guanine527-N7)-methyltransferase